MIALAPRGRRSGRRPRRTNEQLRRQLLKWKPDFTSRQARARLGDWHWRRTRTYLLERGELRRQIVDRKHHYRRVRVRPGPPELPPGGDVFVPEPPIVEPPELPWVIGLLKMFLHMRSQGVTWELEIELDGLTAPADVTTTAGRALRRRMMSEVTRLVSAEDEHFGQFIGMMQFGDRPTAMQVDSSAVAQRLVVWDTTIVRNLSLKQVRQWTYDGGETTP